MRLGLHENFQLLASDVTLSNTGTGSKTGVDVHSRLVLEQYTTLDLVKRLCRYRSLLCLLYLLQSLVPTLMLRVLHALVSGRVGARTQLR